MPVYEIRDGELQPFRRRKAGDGLYEKDVEDLLWDNLENLLGEALFPVARQPIIRGGGRPDVVALDGDGTVVVIEVKRDVDRNQLAQCLEYAGWARTASLDELAGAYHRGPEAFFADWTGFTESASPVLPNGKPELILIARDLHGRTESAVDFLIENGLPVRVVRVTMYEDEGGRVLVDVEGDHEPDSPLPMAQAPAVRARPTQHTLNGRRVQLGDLLDVGLLSGGEELVWRRPNVGQEFRVIVLANGSLRLSDGRTCGSPSKAAQLVADVGSYDGWNAWRRASDDRLLSDLRRELLDAIDRGDGGTNGLGEG